MSGQDDRFNLDMSEPMRTGERHKKRIDTKSRRIEFRYMQNERR